jgi:hypothetical protein
VQERLVVLSYELSQFQLCEGSHQSGDIARRQLSHVSSLYTKGKVMVGAMVAFVVVCHCTIGGVRKHFQRLMYNFLDC